MKKTVCLLFLLLTACTAITPAPTTTPMVMLPTPSLTIEPTATPDVIAPVLNDLQKNGINANYKDGVWILIFDGVEISRTTLNETGLTIIGKDGTSINIPLQDIDRGVENKNGLLVVKDQNGTAIGAFNPVNADAGWMFFDYKAVNPAEITADELSNVSEISLTVDAEGHVHLPEDLMAFEDANVKPFAAEAFFEDYYFFESSSGRKWFDLAAMPGTPTRNLWDNGEYGKRPELRPIVTEFIFKLDLKSAELLGVQGEELFLVGCKFLNNPEAVVKGAIPFGIMNMVIPGPALRELIEIGYFKGDVGFFMPGISQGFLAEEFTGSFSTLLHGGLFDKQGFKQKEIERMLKDVGDRDVVDGNIQKIILLGEYRKVPWGGAQLWFDLLDQ